MSTACISVESLGKRYRIGERRPYRTLRDSLAAAVGIGTRRTGNGANGHAVADDRLWALKDVSFEVQPGEVVGIIGRNGAGKSTLLKILARITLPTTGMCALRGRIGSLLEVGTGFHPELTGRENVYLSGAILGMSRAEIRRKFDEIVEFAEVAAFIDTPIKHYSSGMNLRLAFAVAAHLETEILLIDEVLAVGDMVFQKKCLSRMGEIARERRTVLFVSHNMGAVVGLCERGILLDRGGVVADGSATAVADRYHALQVASGAEWRRDEADGDRPVRLRAITVMNGAGQVSSSFDADERIALRIEYDVRRAIPECQIIAQADNAYGVMVFSTGDTDALNVGGVERRPGRYRTTFFVEPRLLSPGRYTVSVSADVVGYSVFDAAAEAVAFEVSPVRSADPSGRRRLGIVAPVFDWHTDRLSD